MNRRGRWAVFSSIILLTPVLLAPALLAACQALPESIAGFFTTPTVEPTQTPLPTRTPRDLEPMPATYTPVPEQPTPTLALVEKSGLPDLLLDFPLYEGAQVVKEETEGDANGARMALQTSQSPGELAAFYRQALQEKGWTLRFWQPTAVGGFLQEWKNGQTLLTVEYSFSGGAPLVSVDARVVYSNRALALLLGFPLPNGSEVLRADGSAIELYVPQDVDATVEFFRKQVAAERWRWETIKSTGWCGSRGCQGKLEEGFSALAALEPTPTPDKRKTAYYRAIMPDYTEADITFLPQQDDTRVHIQIRFLDLRRSGIPVGLYPKATITAIMPGVAMFETKDALKGVVKFYEGELAGLGWEGYDFTINEPAMYSRSWGKQPGRVVTLSLSAKKGTVYGTLTCATCKDPYYVVPSVTPSPAPSK